MSVEPTTANWLKSEHRTVSAADPAITAIWSEIATKSEIVSPFADRLDASAEATRQLAFLGHAIGVEKCLVEGLRIDLIGQRIDLSTDRGNLNNTRCIVIGADEQREIEATILTVVRRLD